MTVLFVYCLLFYYQKEERKSRNFKVCCGYRFQRKTQCNILVLLGREIGLDWMIVPSVILWSRIKDFPFFDASKVPCHC